MKNLGWTVALVAALAFGVGSPALSHHSHAMFDHTKDVTVNGTVREFLFRNPHVFLYVDVRGDNGETVNYSIEMSNIPNMIRAGITQGTFKPGDTVTINVHPLRDGRPGGNYITIVAADGKTYGRV